MFCLNEDNNKNLNFHEGETDDMALQRAFRQQQKLGRQILWRGMMTQAFGDLQERTYRERNFAKECNGTACIHVHLRLGRYLFKTCSMHV